MQESKGYQRLYEKVVRETTIKHILSLLEQQFHTDAVRALTPIIQNISDLQRLEQLHLAAAKAQNIEAFAQKLIE